MIFHLGLRLAVMFQLALAEAPHDFAKDLKERVAQEIEKVSADELHLEFNGDYYSFEGPVGLEHEQTAAHQYGRWLRQNERLDFMFVPGFGKVTTPGIDGVVFFGDPTRPIKRVSLKSIARLGAHPSIRLVKAVSDATEAADYFGDFDTAYATIFPKSKIEDLERWYLDPPKTYYNRVKLMSVMGLSRGLPTVIVISINDQSAQHEHLSQELISRLEGWKSPLPEQIILIWSDAIQTYNRRENGVFSFRLYPRNSCEDLLVQSHAG